MEGWHCEVQCNSWAMRSVSAAEMPMANRRVPSLLRNTMVGMGWREHRQMPLTCISSIDSLLPPSAQVERELDRDDHPHRDGDGPPAGRFEPPPFHALDGGPVEVRVPRRSFHDDFAHHS